MITGNTMLLSAIMIVKNEEENLLRCLESLRNACNEVIVIDTGSDDKTVEIARTAGARVDFFPWNGDEAAARNCAVAQARGEWLFMIDADEELSPELNLELQRLIPRLKNQPQINSGTVLWENYYLGGETSRTRIPRLSRRTGFSYHGGIHPIANYQGETMALEGVLRHYGYQWTPERRQRKGLHILDHLKPYLAVPHPSFDRWCQYLTALNLIGEEALFAETWAKVGLYTPEERMRSEATASWLENSANFFRYFACLDDFASGLHYANEILDQYPGHITSRFYRLQGFIKSRSWKKVLAESTTLLDLLARDPGPSNPACPAIQTPACRAWQWLAQEQMEPTPEMEPPAWLITPSTLPTFLFNNPAPTIQTTDNGEGNLLLRQLIEAETLDRCGSAAAALRLLNRGLHQWPQLNWLRIGLSHLESAEPFRLDTLAARSVHLL